MSEIVLAALFADVSRQYSGDEENILAFLWQVVPGRSESANDD